MFESIQKVTVIDTNSSIKTFFTNEIFKLFHKA